MMTEAGTLKLHCATVPTYLMDTRCGQAVPAPGLRITYGSRASKYIDISHICGASQQSTYK